MTEHPADGRADHLITDVALPLVHDMRQDTAAAHRVVRYLDRIDLEALACILAAMVPIDIPVSHLAWWRVPQTAEPPTQPCGTWAAAQRHRADREPLDAQCQAAERGYQQGYRARRRAS